MHSFQSRLHCFTDRVLHWHIPFPVDNFSRPAFCPFLRSIQYLGGCFILPLESHSTLVHLAEMSTEYGTRSLL
jgi:hypothetical protein